MKRILGDSGHTGKSQDAFATRLSYAEHHLYPGGWPPGYISVGSVRFLTVIVEPRFSLYKKLFNKKKV